MDMHWQVRYEIYQYFKKHRNAPSLKELAHKLNKPIDVIKDALKKLDKEYHSISFETGIDKILMAWPFSASPTDYPVDTPAGRYWANCAWDALSIPNLLNSDAKTIYQCPDCTEEIDIRIEKGELMPTNAVVHFSIPPRIFFEDLGCI